ncbi:MAG TPA: hypothetical protein VFJ82_03220 [Longimicrobium sp.]|nr:hypothetical protein [Longimicrobium sp.]
MKKMNLHPDRLCVESFTTAQEQAGAAHLPDGADGRFASGNCTSIRMACVPCTESPTCRCVGG